MGREGDIDPCGWRTARAAGLGVCLRQRRLAAMVFRSGGLVAVGVRLTQLEFSAQELAGFRAIKPLRVRCPDAPLMARATTRKMATRHRRVDVWCHHRAPGLRHEIIQRRESVHR